jgi:hypothetical protein
MVEQAGGLSRPPRRAAGGRSGAGENPLFRLSQGEQAYLAACRALQERKRREREHRLRRITLASIAAAVLFVLLASFGWLKSEEANRQTKAALARQLTLQAQSLYAARNSNPMITDLLNIQSMKLQPTGEAARFLLNENKAAPPVSRMAHDASVFASPSAPTGATWSRRVRMGDPRVGLPAG